MCLFGPPHYRRLGGLHVMLCGDRLELVCHLQDRAALCRSSAIAFLLDLGGDISVSPCPAVVDAGPATTLTVPVAWANKAICLSVLASFGHFSPRAYSVCLLANRRLRACELKSILASNHIGKCQGICIRRYRK